MQYPIPDHLKPYLIPTGEDNSELRVTGALRCKCGSALFIPYINEAGTIAAAKCVKCGAKILLLHAGRHGWDGFVAKADYLYDLPTKMHPVEACPHCEAHTPLAVNRRGRPSPARGGLGQRVFLLPHGRGLPRMRRNHGERDRYRNGVTARTAAVSFAQT